MEQNGTLTVRVFTSNAQLPIQGATVVVTRKASNGKYDLLSVQATDSSGTVRPVTIPAPATGNSTRVSEESSNAVCEVWAEAPGYAMLKVEGVQIFPGVVTEQRMELIPLEEGEHGLDRVDERIITGQNL